MKDQMCYRASKLVVIATLGLAVPGMMTSALAAPPAPKVAVNVAVKPMAMPAPAVPKPAPVVAAPKPAPVMAAAAVKPAPVVPAPAPAVPKAK
jgi:hypothetical protein